MLTCACVANAEETAIERPCLLHLQWAAKRTQPKGVEDRTLPPESRKAVGR